MFHVPLLLLSLAAGYGVLILSERQDRPLDVLGRVIGGIIVLVAAIGLICIATCSVGRWRQCRTGGHGCPYAAKADCHAAGMMNPEGQMPMGGDAK